MRTSGSGYSYDGHPFPWWQALLGIAMLLFFPINLIVMAILEVLPSKKR